MSLFSALHGKLPCGCLLTVLAGVSHAQSLPSLFRETLAIDPAIGAAQAQVRAAEQKLVQAWAAFGPTAGITVGYSDTDYQEALVEDARHFWSKQAAVQVNQPVVRTALFPALDGARAQVRQASAAWRQALDASAQAFVEACFEVLKARDALDLARAQAVATAEQLALAQRSFKVGTVTVIDVREAEAKADSVAAQVSAAEYELDLRRQMLAELVGRDVPGLLDRGLNGERLPSLGHEMVSDWLATAEQAPAV